MRGTCFLLSLLWLANVAAAEKPRLSLGADRQLKLAALPPIVTGENVLAHLESGLTTSFMFQIKLGRKVAGGCRIDVRYELWDEIYELTVLEWGGLPRRDTAPDRDGLVSWWRALELQVLDGHGIDLSGRREARVIVDVLPFSQAERDDTERWLSESLDRARRSTAERINDASDNGLEPLGRALDLLIATSLDRDILASYSWQVEIEPREGP